MIRALPSPKNNQIAPSLGLRSHIGKLWFSTSTICIKNHFHHELSHLQIEITIQSKSHIHLQTFNQRPNSKPTTQNYPTTHNIPEAWPHRFFSQQLRINQPPMDRAHTHTHINHEITVFDNILDENTPDIVHRNRIRVAHSSLSHALALVRNQNLFAKPLSNLYTLHLCELKTCKLQFLIC